MTEDDLREIESRLNPVNSLRPEDGEEFYETTIRDLIAEVRRLRGLTPAWVEGNPAID